MTVVLREAEAHDHEAISDVVRAAFGREDEARLVAQLRDGHWATREFVAEVDGTVLAHAMLTVVTVGGLPALALAPVAVHPDHHGRGYGGAVIRAAISAADADGHRVVLVLGAPEYYSRFGFEAARNRGITGPFGDGDEFQVAPLSGYDGEPVGEAVYPPPFGEVG